MKRLILLVLLVPFSANAIDFEKVAYGEGSQYEQTHEGDGRLVRGSDSPVWLEAVGRMIVASDGKYKSCTQTLVTDHPDKKRSKIATTAAHCVSDWKTGLANDAFTIPNEDHVAFWSNEAKAKCAREGNSDRFCGVQFRRIVAVHHYERSPGDVAVVELNDYVDNITPLVAGFWGRAFEQSFLNENGEYHGESEITNFQYMVAGYSADFPLGDKGRHLTYDEGCYFNGGMTYRRDSQCSSYGGASGGAFVLSATLPPFVGELPDECWEEEWGFDWEEGVEIDDPRIPPGYDHMDCEFIGTVYYPTGHQYAVLSGEVNLLVGVLQGGRDAANSSTYWTPIEYFQDELMAILKRF